MGVTTGGPAAEEDGVELATRMQRSAMQLMRRLRATRPAGSLSTSKLLVLGILQRNGATTAARLAGALGIQPQSLTRLLGALQAQRLIARRPDAADQRQVLISLTAAGARALASDLLEQRRRLAEAMRSALTPAEREIMRIAAGLMDRITALIEPAQASPAAREP
jgi:DNA-binding MarR family transcriptional regulator